MAISACLAGASAAITGAAISPARNDRRLTGAIKDEGADNLPSVILGGLPGGVLKHLPTRLAIPVMKPRLRLLALRVRTQPRRQQGIPDHQERPGDTTPPHLLS